MVEIECAGEQLQLLPEKAIFWPSTQTLIVADLHLGKTAAFRQAGIPVPETTTGTDLDRLENILHLTHSRRLIILGDLLHAPTGMQPVMIERVVQWRKKHFALEVILVPGNHDRKAGPLPITWNIQSTERHWPCAPFLFTHEPMQHSAGYVMAGHLHPALSLRDKYGPGVRCACFWFGSDYAVLPAFGSFTGMSNITPRKGDRVFMIGGSEVVSIK